MSAVAAPASANNSVRGGGLHADGQELDLRIVSLASSPRTRQCPVPDARQTCTSLPPTCVVAPPTAGESRRPLDRPAGDRTDGVGDQPPSTSARPPRRPSGCAATG